MEPEQTPEFDEGGRSIELRQDYQRVEGTVYVAHWRGLEGQGETVSEALHKLANKIATQ